MDDRIFFGCVAYLLISAIIVSFLPSDIFGGSAPTALDDDEIRGLYNETGEGGVEGAQEQYSFISKIVRFLFTPWTVGSVPAFIGAVIALVNLFCTLVAVIYLYDKARGI